METLFQRILMAVLIGLISGMAKIAVASEEICTPCPNGVEEIALMVRADDIQNSWVHWASAYQTELRNLNHWMQKNRRLIKAEHGVVKDNAQFKNLVLSKIRACKRISYFHILAHGLPGGFVLNAHNDNDDPNFQITGAFPPEMAQYLFKGFDCGFTPNAHIHLKACQAGQGPKGEKLMMELAKTLLTKGGTVRAATTFESSIPGITTIVTPRPKYLMVSPGLKKATWSIRY